MTSRTRQFFCAQNGCPAHWPPYDQLSCSLWMIYPYLFQNIVDLHFKLHPSLSLIRRLPSRGLIRHNLDLLRLLRIPCLARVMLGPSSLAPWARRRAAAIERQTKWSDWVVWRVYWEACLKSTLTCLQVPASWHDTDMTWHSSNMQSPTEALG